MSDKPVSIRIRPGLDPAAIKDLVYQSAEQLGLQAQETKIQSGLKFTLSDGREVSPLAVYFKGGQASKMVLERPNLALSQRVTAILRPNMLVAEGERLEGGLNRFARYAVISREVSTQIRQNVAQIAEVKEMAADEDSYDLIVSKQGASVRVRLFPNGTLLMQGAGTALWDETCTAVEGLVGSNVLEVATRFVSASEAEVDKVAGLLTPKLREDAERTVRSDLGPAFDFMAQWDQKYLLSSLILLRSGLEVPEYSCMVMPASKAFEGFVRELFLYLAVLEKAETQQKAWTVLQVFRKDSAGKYANPKLEDYVRGGKYRKRFVEKLQTEVDLYRNFMMHSDEAAVTKVDTHVDADEIVRGVLKAIRESFDFFVKGIQ